MDINCRPLNFQKRLTLSLRLSVSPVHLALISLICIYNNFQNTEWWDQHQMISWGLHNRWAKCEVLDEWVSSWFDWWFLVHSIIDLSLTFYHRPLLIYLFTISLFAYNVINIHIQYSIYAYTQKHFCWNQTPNRVFIQHQWYLGCDCLNQVFVFFSIFSSRLMLAYLFPYTNVSIVLYLWKYLLKRFFINTYVCFAFARNCLEFPLYTRK